MLLWPLWQIRSSHHLPGLVSAGWPDALLGSGLHVFKVAESFPQEPYNLFQHPVLLIWLLCNCFFFQLLSRLSPAAAVAPTSKSHPHGFFFPFFLLPDPKGPLGSQLVSTCPSHLERSSPPGVLKMLPPGFDLLLITPLSGHCVHSPHGRGNSLSGLTTIAVLA